MRRRSFRRNEVVYHEGDPGDSLHVVVKGRFVATVTSPLTGLTAAVNIFRPESVFGELALLGRFERTATITALDASETMELRRPDFESMLAEHPAVERFLLMALASQVRRMTDQLSEALFDSVDKRVDRRLLLLHEQESAGNDGWVRVRQEDVAILAGTTRPTVNRILRRLEDEGLVELRRGGFRVIDDQRLRRLAR